MYKAAVLRLARWGPVERFMTNNGRRVGVGRFIAGDSLTDALEVLRRLHADGRRGILDLLGEFVSSAAGAEAEVTEIMASLEALGAEPYERQLSVKPTQLGLTIDPRLAAAHTRRIASRAAEVGAAVCLDMEDSGSVDATLDLFRSVYSDGHHHLSTVLQSYLHRTPTDLDDLLRLGPVPAVRIVKGAYLEPASVAHQDMDAVDDAYRRLLFTALEAGSYVGVATHDEQLIREAEAFIRGAGLGPDRYEFQMLYGIRPRLQQRLAGAGHTLRVYVPYGSDWYGYFSRRLAERPANLWFLARSLVRP